MTSRFHVVLTLGLAAGAPAVSWAQVATDATIPARFHFGPLAVTPKLAIQHLGLDTNVFNTPESPVRDFTALVSPGADAWLRAGRALFTSKTSTDVWYFAQSASERSLNITEDWRIDLSLAHATPRAQGLYLRTRQRPNAEIDDRVLQKRVAAGFGFSVPFGPRFVVDVDTRRSRLDYNEGAYGDPEIAIALNRDIDEVLLRGSAELTPITTVAIRTDFQRDTFAYTASRNSRSLRVMPGLTFKPLGLLSGSAFAGFRRLTTLGPDVPDFSGFVADVELKYVAHDLFRVTGSFKRDLDYSLDLDESFFVDTSAGVEVAQAVGMQWDVAARARRGTLAYQELASLAGRVDRVRLVGVGIGRRVGPDMRVGINLDYVRRVSAVAYRNFDGFRLGGTLTYGY